MTRNILTGLILNPKEVIESITLKKIMLTYPEAASYKKLIKFCYTGKKASMNLSLLPAGLAGKIEALFN